jgi:hypothetical protein
MTSADRSHSPGEGPPSARGSSRHRRLPFAAVLGAALACAALASPGCKPFGIPAEDPEAWSGVEAETDADDDDDDWVDFDDGGDYAEDVEDYDDGGY